MALLLLALVTGIAVVASVSYGEYRVPPLAVVKTLLGLETSDPKPPSARFARRRGTKIAKSEVLSCARERETIRRFDPKIMGLKPLPLGSPVIYISSKLGWAIPKKAR